MNRTIIDRLCNQKVAIELDEQFLTYSELIFYAQRIATYLLENFNLTPGDIICQCVENNLSMMIGVMSIEMVGGVCCSLSSQDSNQQLYKLIKQTQSHLVLVHWLTQNKIKDDITTLNIDSMINIELYQSFDIHMSSNEKIHGCLLQKNNNLYQNMITKLYIPNIPDDSIILFDEHDNIIFTSQYTCREIIHRIKNWDKLKELFVDDIHTDTIRNDISRYIIDTVKQLKPNYITKFILKLCMYRKSYIDDLLQQLMNLFPDQLIIQNDSGSKDPESDYDIRIGSTDGSDADIDACVIFNEFFSIHWCLPSGIVFDTNLYPRHLNTIEPIFNVQGTGLGIYLHIRCDYPYYFFTEINDYKQNKMSVIKLRKCMTGKEWQHYITTITKNDSDLSLKKFFYKAELTYWKYTKQLLTHISKPNELISCALNEITNIISTIKTSQYDTTKFENIWNKIDYEMKHILMEHSNMLFISYLRQARNLEREIRKRKDRYEDSFLHPILRIPPSEMLYIDTLIISMRHKFSKAVYFANDACVAEGSLYYVSIEQYSNHADVSYVRNKILRTNRLTNNHLYQSINEQYSNFLKEIKNYSKKQVHHGRTIYRSSKYLYRLLNTITDLGTNKWNRMGFDGNHHISKLGLIVEELLLSIRKYKYPFDEFNSNYRSQISEYFALGIFPTESQLKTFWKYRRLTLDESSELFKYKNYPWPIMQVLNYQSKIEDLVIHDLKTLAIHIRNYINNTDIISNIDVNNNEQFDAILYIIQQNSLIIKQYTSTILNLVIDCNHKIYHSYIRGMFDYVPDIIRYLFDWKITRFNIVIKYARHKEYSRIKKSKVYDYITINNYIIGIIFGIRLACIQMFIIAPIMFLIEPIQKSVWILKTLCKIEQPYDRILLHTRAAYRTLNTGNITVVHDSRIIDTGITIRDAYGTNTQISYIIGILRLLATIIVKGIVWFSWMIVITDLISVINVTVSWKYIYIIQNLYVACLVCVSVIVFVLNTWTTIRRYLLLYDSRNAQYLATVRENQGTRAYYLAILSYIIFGIIFNIIFNLLDLENEQWINITPFAQIFNNPVSHLSPTELTILIILQGIAITLIDVINRNARGNERLPDYELSDRNRIGRKEWLNFPVGTICSLLKLRKNMKKRD
ncbi:unnamed protein product [Adineta steineri]|uniref:AMP-dependent synthetase/ligase domain-containing protein n=2 Tax=Adineta steineri TaxID=433720 RepID=A0A819M8A9_9BILA|nr:unnamed protein product [Adineta steineri]CAF3975943.1 unnamed protein product [Adineta steineri]